MALYVAYNYQTPSVDYGLDCKVLFGVSSPRTADDVVAVAQEISKRTGYDHLVITFWHELDEIE
jgi:hypothetical protein